MWRMTLDRIKTGMSNRVEFKNERVLSNSPRRHLDRAGKDRAFQRGVLQMTRKSSSALHQNSLASVEAFQRAVGFHQQGCFQEAGLFYELVLKTEPRHFDALYHLGSIRLQQNRFNDAADLF